MIVYEATKQQFQKDNDNDDIEDVILRSFESATGRIVAAAEMNAWKNSLGAMSRVLRDEEIPNDIGVAIELHIPQTSKRIDITLTGLDASGKQNVVLVELKQWAEASATSKDAIVKTLLGRKIRETVHPSYQAWSYASLLEGFNEAVYSGGIQVHACAYLHNYTPDDVIDGPHYQAYISKAPLFMKGRDELARMRAFIKQHIAKGDEKSVLHELMASPIRPSKALADSLVKLLKKQAEFVLIDDQKEIHENCMAAAAGASTERPKVVIIEGGPGTGKSVVALNLLVNLTSRGLVGKYVSKNSAPRQVYESKLTGALPRSHFSQLFTGSGSFMESPTSAFDFLVVDEAHRLTEKSDLYGQKGDNQIKELINAANCTIFFIDEDQRVTLKDIGNREAIRAFAKTRGAEVEEYVLTSQFRCSGSDGYLAWLDNALQVRETANRHLDTEEYEFKVFDTPQAMHAAIQSKNGNNKARVVAGYCWPWNSKKRASDDDIVIGEHYRRQWNLEEDEKRWIIAQNSVEQVGCIHTCQGLEVDYIGVIIGPDLIIRGGNVVTVPEQRDKNDRSVYGYKKLMKAEPEKIRQLLDLIIKNTYRTLMTRGMKGCYLYCTDEETAQYFRERLLVRKPDTSARSRALLA
ncbi:DUF2075 domain-containing protein [Pseudomonas vanderleydeniana]|uniref:DUF2075 domain-containing protein n=1 Tax=Pseudomonas vanderleydeniana TaxID=2745495 RepID=A0A9E6PKH4_9PSED|nr:DUF2075 domain-containing protein [Pseudomonas vanderleydeniana]QXI27848.1 DUF2075 domain-containing protein [Pseudomonas vanderleydeniana]